MNQIRLEHKISFHPPNHLLIQILYKLKARILTLKFDKFMLPTWRLKCFCLYQAQMLFSCLQKKKAHFHIYTWFLQEFTFLLVSSYVFKDIGIKYGLG